MDPLTDEIGLVAQQLNHLIEEARQRQQRAGMAQTTSSAAVMALLAMQSKMYIEMPPPLGWPGWPPGLWRKGVSLLQRLSHRAVAWMMGSLVAQQNQFNATAVRAVQSLLAEQAEMQSAYQHWEAQLAALSRDVERMQQQRDEPRT